MESITVKTAILLAILVALLAVIGTSYYYKSLPGAPSSAQAHVEVKVVPAETQPAAPSEAEVEVAVVVTNTTE